MNRWLLDRLSGGDAVLVPAIIYYELRRELLRAQKAAGDCPPGRIRAIDPDRYLPLTDQIKHCGSPRSSGPRSAGKGALLRRRSIST